MLHVRRHASSFEQEQVVTLAKLSTVSIAMIALALGGCSTLESFNPFGAEKYETKVLNDVPADDIYNQGLARLGKKDNEGAAKKFSDLDKQYPFSDYSRKGLLDGISIRLPTICVRPGLPNKAASGFFSNIIREPLAGKEAVLPVSEDVRHWHASPRSAVGFLIHAGTMDLNTVGPRRALSMPGLSVTVGEQIAALERVAGKSVTAGIKREPDQTIMGIVAGWSRDFITDRAVKLGFTTAEKTFDDIIRIHIEDELGGKFAA